MKAIPAGAGSTFLRPTWAAVDLARVRRNFLRMTSAVGRDCRILFVVKANAYGHGAVPLALQAQEKKLCWGFGVSSVEEAAGLYEAGVNLPILILGSLYPFESFVNAIENGFHITISSVEAAVQVAEAALRLGKKAHCHVKLETGMGRIGVRRPGALKVLQDLSQSAGTVISGLYTHLSSTDCDPEFTRLQLRCFRETVEDCLKTGINPGIKHAANSFAAIHYPESRWDMVRPGLAVYGLMDGFEPAFSFKSRIVFIKNIRAGVSVGYGRSFRSRKPMKVATLPVGYADGYSRRLSNCGEVLVRGFRCRVLGTVTMDMTMVDVTHVAGAAVGDEAVLIGAQGNDEITVQDMSALSDTIVYDTICSVSSRVPRIYTDDNSGI
ncbi:MAG: alanine racemase [bacterium]